MRTAYVNGRDMTAAEIIAWVQQTRGYTIARKTLQSRMRAGLYGELLISKPGNGGRKRTRGVYEQKLVRVSVPGWGCRT